MFVWKSTRKHFTVSDPPAAERVEITRTEGWETHLGKSFQHFLFLNIEFLPVRNMELSFWRKVVKDLMKIKLTILQSSPVFHRPGWWEDPWKASDFQKSDSNPSGIRKKSTWDEKKKSIWDEKKIHLGCPLTLRTLPAAMETSFLRDRCWKYRITVFWTQCVLPCYPNTLCVWPVCCRVTCIQWNHSLAHCLP